MQWQWKRKQSDSFNFFSFQISLLLTLFRTHFHFNYENLHLLFIVWIGLDILSGTGALLFTFHYFKLSHTVHCQQIIITVYCSKTPFHFHFFHSYFSLITTHFHFSFFDNHFHVSLFETHSHFSLQEIRLLQNQLFLHLASPSLRVLPSLSRLIRQLCLVRVVDQSVDNKSTKLSLPSALSMSIFKLDFAGWLKSPTFGLFVPQCQCPLVRSDSLISPSKPKAWYQPSRPLTEAFDRRSRVWFHP